MPVGIGDEADRRVERQFRPDGRHCLRIIRQHGLKTHQRIKQDKTEKVEEQHGKRIGRPVLLFALACSGKGIEAALDRHKNRRKQGAFTTKNTRHIEAERLHQRKNDPAKQQNLKPSIEGHCIELSIAAASRSEAFGANESIGEIGGDKDGDGTAEDIVEYHRSLRLKPVAGARIGKAEGEKHRRCADQNKVHHDGTPFFHEEPDRKKSAAMWDVAFHSFWLRKGTPSLPEQKNAPEPHKGSRRPQRE
ncbi:hypothetical protein AGR3A_Lc130150 [Agrobacterium tomkonis CFBP 6623]|uniref:Uncharacterized protein n=1 Tax=Agrobacterium tomkonis CFBP 6623 TaxID=1183432 RepID=A0A1S7R9L7_9HYPH|nr:hypothetical protein AGR3A_Lc130150 [Agrobacterium tomkonis CFBP 6623]